MDKIESSIEILEDKIRTLKREIGTHCFRISAHSLAGHRQANFLLAIGIGVVLSLYGWNSGIAYWALAKKHPGGFYAGAHGFVLAVLAFGLIYYKVGYGRPIWTIFGGYATIAFALQEFNQTAKEVADKDAKSGAQRTSLWHSQMWIPIVSIAYVMLESMKSIVYYMYVPRFMF
jgi:hypothetical protein